MVEYFHSHTEERKSFFRFVTNESICVQVNRGERGRGAFGCFDNAFG